MALQVQVIFTLVYMAKQVHGLLMFVCDDTGTGSMNMFVNEKKTGTLSYCKIDKWSMNMFIYDKIGTLYIVYQHVCI